MLRYHPVARKFIESGIVYVISDTGVYNGRRGVGFDRLDTGACHDALDDETTCSSRSKGAGEDVEQLGVVNAGNSTTFTDMEWLACRGYCGPVMMPTHSYTIRAPRSIYPATDWKVETLPERTVRG